MSEANTAQPDADMTPFLVADNANPEPGRAPEPAPQAAQPAPEPTEPTLMPDPRDAIAKRAQERRMAEEAQFGPKDTNFVPPSVAYPKEDDPPDSAAQQQDDPEGAAQQAAPSDSEQKPYAKLKVNGVELSVSRAKLLQYADLLDEEAQGIPDRALIKIAQQNIAAEDNLERAKEIRRAAKQDAARGVANPGEATVPDQAAGQPQQTRTEPHQLTSKEVAESIQFDDPETAAEKLDQFFGYKAQEAVRAQQRAQQIAEVENHIDQAIQHVSLAHPDIAADPVATRAVLAEVEVVIAEELQKQAGATAEQLEYMRRHVPGSILTAYKLALSEGKAPPPMELLQSSVGRVRQSFGRPAPAAHPGVSSRDAAKQNLTTQPTRGGPSQPPANANAEGPGRYSDAIRAMRKARGQSV